MKIFQNKKSKYNDKSEGTMYFKYFLCNNIMKQIFKNYYLKRGKSASISGVKASDINRIYLANLINIRSTRLKHYLFQDKEAALANNDMNFLGDTLTLLVKIHLKQIRNQRGVFFKPVSEQDIKGIELFQQKSAVTLKIPEEKSDVLTIQK